MPRFLPLVTGSALVLLVSLSLVGPAWGVITWTGSIDDSWHNPGNWDLNRLPGQFEDVVIPDLPGTAQVRHTAGTTNIRSFTCSEILVLSGSVLTISASSSSSKSLTIDGQATLGGAGNLFIYGDFHFNEGTMSGAGSTVIDSLTTWDVGLDGDCAFNRSVVNYGTGIQLGGQLNVGSAKTFRNKDEAEFGGSVVIHGPGNIINELRAVIRTSLDNGLIDCLLHNTGTIRVESGDLVINDFNGIESGALVRGTYDLSGVLEVPDVFAMNSSTIVLRGPLAQFRDGSGTDILRSMTTNAGLMQIFPGNAQPFDSLRVNQGAFEIESGAVLTLPRGCEQTARWIHLRGGTLVLPFLNLATGSQLLGSGTIFGDVTNSGTTYPGLSPGLGNITVQGVYTQTGSGRLVIDVTGAGHDQLQVTGVARLAGQVQIVPSSGYAPGPSDIYPFLTAADVDLGFTSEILPLALHPNDCPATYYQPTSVSYRVFFHTEITGQPQGQVVCGGSPASLSVTALNGFSYQWRRNAVPIVGAYSSVLNIPSLVPSQAGSYDVVVTGACTAETSEVAVLTYRQCDEPAWNSVWLAGSGQLPSPGCWNGFDNATPEQPTLAGGTLTLATSEFTENMYYERSSALAVSNNLFIEARLRIVTEAHIDGNPRRGVGINFGVTADSTNRLFIGRDSLFVWSAFNQAGPVALVDTDDGFHDYLIQVVNRRDIFVYQDDILVLSGALIVAPPTPQAPYFWWGDGTDAGRAVSEWQHVKHNASTFVCGPSTITWTGAAGSSWHAAGSWDRSRVPGFGDNVVIPDLPGTSSVTYSSGSTTIDRLTTNETLNLTGGTLDIATASSSTKGMSLAGGTLTGTGNLDISGGFSWSLGTMSGTGVTTIGPGVSWTAATSANCTLSRTLVNQGILTRNTANRSVVVNSPGIFRNVSGATCRIGNNQANFTGTGQFRNEAGALLHNTALSSIVTCGVLNSGTVRVNSGTGLEFTNLLDLVGGTLGGGGTYDLKGILSFPSAVIQNGATILLSGGPAGLFGDGSDALRNLNQNLPSGSIRIAQSKVQSFNALVTNLGFIDVDSAGVANFNAGLQQAGGQLRNNLSTVTVSPALTIQQGVLTGGGTIVGNVVNEATLATGSSPGRLRIEGNYTQAPGASWLVELGGLTPATQYDQLEVTGAASLAGSLTVSNIDGFVPAPGDSFRILTAGSRTGTFANVTLPAQPACMTTSYGAAGVTVAACPAGGVGPDGGTASGPLAMSMVLLRNPARGSVELAITSSREVADARLTVIGPAGRRIRSIALPPLLPGASSVRWDPRDDSGRRIPAGMYFLVLESAGRSMAVGRVLIVD